VFQKLGDTILGRDSVFINSGNELDTIVLVQIVQVVGAIALEAHLNWCMRDDHVTLLYLRRPWKTHLLTHTPVLMPPSF